MHNIGEVFSDKKSRNTIWITVIVSLCFSASLPESNANTFEKRFFNVYTDKDSLSNHFYPTGWIGDWEDVRFDDDCRLNPYNGRTCIEVTYFAEGSGMLGWAGIYWLFPDNNWGEVQGGFNLTGVVGLSFWVKGINGGEGVEFRVGGITGLYGDSLQPAASTGTVSLTSTWQRLNIDLYKKNVSRVVGGFCWIANKTLNPNGMTFYLDDIVYEYEHVNGTVSIMQPVAFQELKAGLEYTVTIEVCNSGNLPTSEFNLSLVSSSGIVFLHENSKTLVLEREKAENASFEMRPEGIGDQTIKAILSCGDEKLAEHEIKVSVVEPSFIDLLHRNFVTIFMAIILSVAIVTAAILLRAHHRIRRETDRESRTEL